MKMTIRPRSHFIAMFFSQCLLLDIQQIKDISDFFIRENKEANANHEGADSVLLKAQRLVLVHVSLHGSCNGAK